MKRVFLFIATNLAIIILLSVTLRLIGVESILDEQGVGLNLNALLVFSAVFGMGGSFISLAISKWTAKRFTGAQVIEQPRNDTEAWLVNTIQGHARGAGIGMPEVAVYDSPDPNAFATGARRNKALVAVSTGLLRSMKSDEVSAVLGHEVSHIANGDMVTLALIQGVVNTFVIFLARVIGHVVDRVVFKTERGYGIGYFITVIVAQIVLGILASVIVLWFSRRRAPGGEGEDDSCVGIAQAQQRADSNARTAGGLRHIGTEAERAHALLYDAPAAGRTDRSPQAGRLKMLTWLLIPA